VRLILRRKLRARVLCRRVLLGVSVLGHGGLLNADGFGRTGEFPPRTGVRLSSVCAMRRQVLAQPERSTAGYRYSSSATGVKWRTGVRSSVHAWQVSGNDKEWRTPWHTAETSSRN
jgi:hypothetical protein